MDMHSLAPMAIAGALTVFLVSPDAGADVLADCWAQAADHAAASQCLQDRQAGAEAARAQVEALQRAAMVDYPDSNLLTRSFNTTVAGFAAHRESRCEFEAALSEPGTGAQDIYRGCAIELTEAYVRRVASVLADFGAGVAWQCDDGTWPITFFADTDQGASVLLVDAVGQAYDLSQVPSGSGSKYEAGEVLFWMQGDEATFGTPVGETNCLFAGD